jgi:hypothetical protein
MALRQCRDSRQQIPAAVRAVGAFELGSVQRETQPAAGVLALHKPNCTGRFHNKANLNPKLDEE